MRFEIKSLLSQSVDGEDGLLSEFCVAMLKDESLSKNFEITSTEKKKN